MAERGRTLFRLFQHPSLTIVKGAGLVMKAIIEEGELAIGERMQQLALAEGALPQHEQTERAREALRAGAVPPAESSPIATTMENHGHHKPSSPRTVIYYGHQ